MKEFDRFCYTGLADENYVITEKTYSEKVTATGKDVEIEWEAKKKISDYFRFVIKANWRILGMTTVEIQKEGTKVNIQKGYAEIKVSGTLEKDWLHRWEGNAFAKFLRGVYDRYIIRGRVDQYETKLFKECDEFIAQAKSFVALEGQH